MTENGPPIGMSFPQKVHTEDEDFVIELDENHMGGPHDGYGMDDRNRCKRRKRCGQCGPCQVKENCNKCHFCIRKDVLKQTCIYRKCVYLRSKPKPYSRPHQSPQGRSNATSPPSEMMQPSPHVRSPPIPSSNTAMPFTEQVLNMPDPRPENHLYFPAQLPHQAPMGTQQNNGFISPAHPGMERTPSLPNTAVNNNMQMNLSSPLSQLQNHATSPPLPKPPDPASPHHVPQPVNSPVAAPIPGIPVTSCSNVPPSLQPVGPTIPPVMSQMSSHGSLPNIPAIPSIPGISERPLNEFRHPDQFSLGPHHPHPHYPPVHPHNVMSHRDTGLFSDPARISHMNFNHASPMDTLGRGPNDSSCMYHPGLPYSMPGHYQPSGSSFLPGAAEMNPFRSNFLNSFPPGYSYPPERFREGFGPLPFSRLGMSGMSSSSSFPQYPGQASGGYGVGNSLSQQYYNSQHGCPKNVSRPPVSPSTDDVKVLQAGYNINKHQTSPKSKQCGSTKDESSDVPRNRHNSLNDSGIGHDSLCIKEEDSQSERSDTLSVCSSASQSDHLRPWADFYTQRSMGRYESIISPSARYSHWDPWRMSPWYSPRRDDVRSRASTSTLSSDFECEVISIDDQQVNALIRSDGCNSIEIEVDNRSGSLCSSESSPQKLAPQSLSISDFLSPEKVNCPQFSPNMCLPNLRSPQLREIEKRRLSWCESEKGNENISRKGSSLFQPLESMQKQLVNLNSKEYNADRALHSESWFDRRENSVKSCFKDNICIRQDLGEDGIMQLELPGHKVTVENAELTDDWLAQCSNVNELKAFLAGNPDTQATTAGTT